MTQFQAMEAEAREITWRAYRRRNQGRLFELPAMESADELLWPKWDDTYWDKAVGIVSPFGSEWHDWRSFIAVGVWRGIRPSFLGIDLHLIHFSGPGSTLHRSPLLIHYVHVLPEAFQRIPQKWREQDRVEDSASYRCHCEYVYKDDEYPCRCHYTCANCCLAYEAQERKAA